MGMVIALSKLFQMDASRISAPRGVCHSDDDLVHRLGLN